jgi:hypothetical protein
MSNNLKETCSGNLRGDASDVRQRQCSPSGNTSTRQLLFVSSMQETKEVWFVAVVRRTVLVSGTVIKFSLAGNDKFLLKMYSRVGFSQLTSMAELLTRQRTELCDVSATKSMLTDCVGTGVHVGIVRVTTGEKSTEPGKYPLLNSDSCLGGNLSNIAWNVGGRNERLTRVLAARLRGRSANKGRQRRWGAGIAKDSSGVRVVRGATCERVREGRVDPVV